MRNSLVLAFALAAGCSSGSQQVLTGHVAPGFPATITEVKVMRGTSVVATAPVAKDGSFQLAVTPASGLSIRLVGASHANLVMPRQSGAIQSTFSVRAGGAPFDLGAIHFVGSSSSTTFSFHDSSSMGDCDSEDHDSSGATCVCDDHHEDDTCEAEGSESETDSSLTAEDGSGSGSSSSSSDGDSEDGHDDGDCVPEHDFPENGCAGSGSGSGSASGSGSGSGSGGPV